MINASVITIGDELLIGQVVDTNSSFIAGELNRAGFKMNRRVAVGDDKESITIALDEEKKHSDIILITGGLGPTADDITKPLLCEYFGGNLIIDKAAAENVRHLFTEVFRRELTERNLKQAEVPDNCTVMQNKRGTAPGMIFTQVISDRKKVFFSMPGVPHEMAGMMKDDVIPFLQRNFIAAKIVHRTLLTAGIGESAIADMIKNFEESLPDNIKLAYLPSYGMVRLRLTATGNAHENIDAAVDEKFILLQSLVQEHLVTNIDEPLEKALGTLLKARGKKMATAESCTGGYIAHLITAHAGASDYYAGSVVSYSYEAKESLLQVTKRSLETKGAVSEEVVREMASGLLNTIDADYAIAVSGIMGPGGGLPDKPAGTVWVCVGTITNLVTKRFHFRFDRERNIRFTALNALNMLRKFILEDGKN